MKTTVFVAESATEALAQIRAELGPAAVVLDVRRLSGTGFSRLWQKPRIQMLAGLPDKESPENKPLNALLQKIAELNQKLPPLPEQDRDAVASILGNISEFVPSPMMMPPLPLQVEAGQGENSSKTISHFESRSGRALPGSAGVPPAQETTSPRNEEPAGETPALPLRAQDEIRPPTMDESRSHEHGLPSARPSAIPSPTGGDGWTASAPTVAALEALGLLPVHAQRIAERVRVLSEPAATGSLERNLSAAQGILNQLWRQPPWKHEPGTPQTHVLVGAPGAGKTTSLCKWLAQVVLLGGRSAQVWRLDGRTANTAEALSIYAEILGVPVQRSWSPEQGRGDGEMLFIDLPGVDWQDSAAVTELGQRLKEFEGAHLHLVLNAAYDVSLLLDQARAFSALPIADLIITHLDEEHRRGKLWNLALGPTHAISFLTAGQNVPGYFRKASADQLWPADFPPKDEAGPGRTPPRPHWQSIC